MSNDLNNIELENNIKAKISNFFQWINISIIEQYYISDLLNWDAICASLHILKDLQRPKAEYYSLHSINYLETIGIMQTVFIEQDSIQTLFNSLLQIKPDGFKLNNYDAIRLKRNQVFGHPSDKKNGPIKTRHFFDIKDKQTQVVKHLYWGTEHEIESEEFSIKNLVLDNSKITFEYLLELEIKFKDKINKIMAEYQVQFKAIFNGASYIFEKLLTKENDRIVIDNYEDEIDKEIERVKIGLEERKILQDFEKQIQLLEFFSLKLKHLFYKQTFHDIEFYSYCSILREKINKLSKELKEIEIIW